MIISSFAFTQEEQRKSVRINRIQNNTGKRWAICIGINDYEDNTIIKLKKARNDAKELGRVFKENGQFDTVIVMTDDLDPRGADYPKLGNIKRKLDFLKGFIEPQDLVVFSFSGHGISNNNGDGFLLTVDSYCDDFYGNSLKVNDITMWLKEIKVKKSLLLLDACREHFQEGKALNLNGLKTGRFFYAEVGAVFYSTRSGWFSYEDKNGNFGVFSKYVIEGLMGMADSVMGNNDGIVSFSELSSYVDEEVSRWALNENKKQRPYTKILGEKFGDLALSTYINNGNQNKKEDNKQITEDKPFDTPESLAKGSQLISDIFKKKYSGYKELKSLEISGDMKMTMMGRSMDMGIRIVTLYPEKTFIEVTVMGMKMPTIINGKKGVSKGMGQEQILSEGEIYKRKFADLYDIFHNKDKYKFQYLWEKELDAKKYDVIYAFDKKNNWVKFFIDKETGLIAIEEKVSEVPGMAGISRTINSDVRYIKGIPVTFKTETFIDDKSVMQMTLKEVKVNQPVDNSLFIIDEKK